MSDYLTDREWSDQFTTQVNEVAGRAIGPHLFSVAPALHDQKRASDFVILKNPQGLSIGVRLRRYGAYPKYGTDITMRLGRLSGAETEFAKIEKGFCGFQFYGHVNEADTAIQHYVLINLDRFRMAWRDGLLRYRDQINRDGVTSFRAFDMRSFPKGIVLEASPSVRALIVSRPTITGPAYNPESGSCRCFPRQEYRKHLQTGEYVLVCTHCNGLWDQRETDEFVGRICTG